MKNNSKAMRAVRHGAAVKRNAQRAARTPQEQMALIAKRPGASKRETARLAKQIGA